MRELRGEIAVVCEQKHAGSVPVKASHGIDALLAGTLHDVKHRSAAVGVIVGGDAVFRLVEKDVALALGSHYLVVVFHNIVAGDFSSKFGHNLPVDLHFSSGDVPSASRREHIPEFAIYLLRRSCADIDQLPASIRGSTCATAISIFRTDKEKSARVAEP